MTRIPVRMVQSPIYRLLRERLSPGTRLAVSYAEDEIASDPGLGPNRRLLDDGAVIDTSLEAVLIQYRPLDPQTIELERVFDLRSV